MFTTTFAQFRFLILWFSFIKLKFFINFFLITSQYDFVFKMLVLGLAKARAIVDM